MQNLSSTPAPTRKPRSQRGKKKTGCRWQHWIEQQKVWLQTAVSRTTGEFRAGEPVSKGPKKVLGDSEVNRSKAGCAARERLGGWRACCLLPVSLHASRHHQTPLHIAQHVSRTPRPVAELRFHLAVSIHQQAKDTSSQN